MKKLLPEFRHGKHAMRRVAVVEKGLKKQGKVPVYNKENDNGHEPK